MGDSLLLRRIDETTGLEITLYEMLVNTRVCVGWPDTGWYDRGWCFARTDDLSALMIALLWDGIGEAPPGPWMKDTFRQIYREPEDRDKLEITWALDRMEALAEGGSAVLRIEGRWSMRAGPILTRLLSELGERE